MKRLIGFARNLGSETREACKCFPLTMSAVFLAGFLICIVSKMGWMPDRMLGSCAFFFFLFASGSYLMETIFLGKNRWYWYAELVVLLISTVGTVGFIVQNGIRFLQYGGIVWGGIGRYLAGYCIMIAITTVYIWYRRSGLGTERYLIGVLQRFGKITITFILIALGCMVLSRVFSYLILERKDLSITDSLLGLTITFFYIPSLSMVWREDTDKIGVFVERMVKFVFLPISIVSGIIMYLYIIKLLIPFTIPSNQIFRMMTVLFIGGMATWTLIGYFEEDSWYMRMAEKLPYFYLPFLLVQGYTLGIRLAYYGMTPNRYLGVLILLFEFLYLCCYRILKEQVGNILPVYVVLIFLATWMPGVNVEGVSIKNQKAILEQYFIQDDTEVSETTWKRIYGAYVWLSEQPECNAYIANMFTDEDVEEMQRESGNMVDSMDNMYWLYDSKLVDGMDVSAYQTVMPIHSVTMQYPAGQKSTEHMVNAVQSKVDLTKVACQTDGQQDNQKDLIVLNMQKVFDEYIQYYQEHDFQKTQETHEYMKKHNVFKLSENQSLYVNSIEVVLDQEKMEITKYTISGYLLEK